MDRITLEARLRELNLYSIFYMRKELKPLASLLEEREVLNCLFTGVHEANRKMVAITDSRVIILFTGALGNGDVKVIRRGAVTGFEFRRKLFSECWFEAAGERHVFTNTQGGLKELFLWAMSRPALEEPEEIDEEETLDEEEALDEENAFDAGSETESETEAEVETEAQAEGE